MPVFKPSLVRIYDRHTKKAVCLCAGVVIYRSKHANLPNKRGNEGPEGDVFFDVSIIWDTLQWPASDHPRGINHFQHLA